MLTEVVHGGLLKSNKGMNLPGVKLSTPALTEKDRRDLAFGVEHRVDYVALSFVRQAARRGGDEGPDPARWAAACP